MKQNVRQFLLPLKRHAIFAALIIIASFAFAIRAAAQQEIDTSASDARIKMTLAKVKSPNATDADKRALAAAYLERANIYYNAGVPTLYKLALGDFRRALRYDPNNSEAHEKAEMLVSIYNSMGRPVPPNGNDPSDDGIDTKDGANRENKTIGAGVGKGIGLESGVENARRVRFAPGQTTRTLKGSVARDTFERFVISAKAGQKLTLRLASPESKVSGTPNAVVPSDNSKQASLFRILNARTKEVLKGAHNVTAWSGEIADDGDYIIEITTSQTKVSYTLVLTLGDDVETRSY